MEQIINYRDIPTDKRIDILNALERIGFFPAYGGVRTMSAAMTRTRPADRTLRFIILLLARWTCPNNRPTYPTQCASAG